MDDKKKLLGLVGVIAIALAAVGLMMSKGTGGEAPEHKAGSLEEGINHDNGLPLNPPSQRQGSDPSL